MKKQRRTRKDSLSEQQKIEICAQAVVEGKTQSDAFRLINQNAKKWKPETLWKRACEFAARGKVRGRITELKTEHMKRHYVTVDRVLQGFVETAFLDFGEIYDEHGQLLHVKDMPEHVRRALVSVKHNRIAGEISTVDIKMADRLKAQEMLARYLEMFKDKDSSTSEELAKLLRALNAEVGPPQLRE